jgi:hypothetical protein
MMRLIGLTYFAPTPFIANPFIPKLCSLGMRNRFAKAASEASITLLDGADSSW